MENGTRQTGASRRVLLIDDDAGFRTAVKYGLSARGFEVWEAADGEDAFDTLWYRGRPDAVLLDLSMPRMNGWKFLDELRDAPEWAEVPVVVLTGARDAHLLDADAFLVKPVTLSQITRALEDELS